MEESVWELLTEVNWKMIMFTLAAGGILSILGDRIGMKFAKRRVSLWGLRPRYTSSILTAFTGTLISLFVVVILALVSESVRTSLFSMQFIQRQIADLTRQLQDSRNEQQVSSLMVVEAQQQLDRKQRELDDAQERLARTREDLSGKQAELTKLQSRADNLREATERLGAERARLEESVRSIRENLGKLQEGRIVAFSEERLAQETVPGGVADEAGAARALDRLDERVRNEVARRASAVPASVVVEDEAGSREAAVSRILAYDSRKVVLAIARQNVTAGQTVRVAYRVYESSLVFSAGEALISRVVGFSPGLDEAETILSFMLRRLNALSTASGIITDSLTGMVGGIPANDFYDAVERIASAAAPLRVTVLAAGDIYSEGPVSVKIDVAPAGADAPVADEELPALENPGQSAASSEETPAAPLSLPAGELPVFLKP